MGELMSNATVQPIIQPLTIVEGRRLITPLIANQIVQNCKYRGQRKLQMPAVDKWAAMILAEDGEFLRDQGISFGKLFGIFFLLNGQHRLHAVIKSGHAISFDITIYECKDEADLAKHYARFDSESLGRSLKDIVANDPMVSEDFPPAYLAKLCESVPLIDCRFKNIAARKLPASVRIREHRLELARQWYREARLYREFAKGKPALKVARFFGPVQMAVAMVTLRHNPKEAEEFWRRAMDDDGLKIGDPARALREAWAKLGPNSKRKWTRYELGWLASQAWNAEYRQQKVKHLRMPLKADKAEIYIEGAPY